MTPSRPLRPSLTSEEEIERGRKAAELLENPLLTEALDALQADAQGRWRKTTLDQIQQREELWYFLRGLDSFRAYLTKFIQTGKLALTVEAERRSADGSRPAETSGFRNSPDS